MRVSSVAYLHRYLLLHCLSRRQWSLSLHVVSFFVFCVVFRLHQPDGFMRPTVACDIGVSHETAAQERCETASLSSNKPTEGDDTDGCHDNEQEEHAHR